MTAAGRIAEGAKRRGADAPINQEMVAKLASAHERLMQKVANANAANDAKHNPKHNTKQDTKTS